MRIPFMLGVCAGLALSPILAAEPDLQALVRRLGDPDCAVRVKAHASLRALGETDPAKVLSALPERDPDPEIQARSLALRREILTAIPVVKTWGDLEKRPPIELSGGGRVRLGIESTACSQGSCVFLYCLAEGCVPIGRGVVEGRLGPR